MYGRCRPDINNWLLIAEDRGFIIYETLAANLLLIDVDHGGSRGTSTTKSRKVDVNQTHQVVKNVALYSPFTVDVDWKGMFHVGVTEMWSMSTR